MKKKLWTIFLVVLLILLQIRLWFGEGSLTNIYQLNQYISVLEIENKKLMLKNEAMQTKIDSIKKDLSAIEDHAREEMMMIGKDEILFIGVDKSHDNGQ